MNCIDKRQKSEGSINSAKLYKVYMYTCLKSTNYKACAFIDQVSCILHFLLLRLRSNASAYFKGLSSGKNG